MIYYLAFGPLYRFPRRIQEDNVGYGYLVDPAHACKDATDSKICEKVEDKSKCEEELGNFGLCIEQVDKWLHSINEDCYEQINALENCVDTQQNCITEVNAFRKCEIKLNRPPWIRDSYLKHLEHIEKPHEKKK